jgi:hypothetical protein
MFPPDTDSPPFPRGLRLYPPGSPHPPASPQRSSDTDGFTLVGSPRAVNRRAARALLLSFPTTSMFPADTDSPPFPRGSRLYPPGSPPRAAQHDLMHYAAEAASVTDKPVNEIQLQAATKASREIIDSLPSPPRRAPFALACSPRAVNRQRATPLPRSASSDHPRSRTLAAPCSPDSSSARAVVCLNPLAVGTAAYALDPALVC